jgi:hypothetical protein
MKAGLKLTAVFGVLFVFFVGGARIALAAPPKNACSLLTTAQVSAVVGTSVGAGTPLLPTDTKACRWHADAAKIQVQLFLKDAQAFAMAKMPFSGKTVVSASGIGDDAVYTSGGGTPAVLSVRKGDVSFNVHVLKYGLPDDKVKAMEKTLALDVLAKL